MSTLQIPLPLSELLHKLAVLSLIEKDYKLNVNTLSFVSNESWYGAFSRYYYGESRKSLIEMLNKVIQQTIQAIQDYANTEFCKLVINHLALARGGINNLRTTYDDDPNILAQLEIILENIDIQLDKNKNLITNLINKPTIVVKPDISEIFNSKKNDSSRERYPTTSPIDILIDEANKELISKYTSN